MPTLSIVFIVFGAFLIRQTLVGRAKETPTDLKDATTALLNGDTAGVAAVMARRGSNTSAVDSSSASSLGGGSLASGGSTALSNEVVKLGTGKPYVLGGEGPNSYDCSGLVWRALYTLGIYKGPRFTTATFEHIAPGFAQKIPVVQGVSGVAVGDICIWVQGGHMGVVTGPDQYFSARSPSKGIGYATLSGDISYFGTTPDYWRVNG